jgi:hypothetical protein
LQRARELEDAEEDEAHHVGGQCERENERPGEDRRAGEAIGGDEPGEAGPDRDAAGADAEEKRDRVPDDPGKLGEPEMGPDLDRRRPPRREEREQRKRDDGGNGAGGECDAAGVPSRLTCSRPDR